MRLKDSIMKINRHRKWSRRQRVPLEGTGKKPLQEHTYV